MIGFWSFTDEMIKIAESKEERQKRGREKLKRIGKSVAVGALGFGAGYGAGSAAGRFIAGSKKWKGMKYTPLVLGGISALGAVAAQRRRELEDKYVNE